MKNLPWSTRTAPLAAVGRWWRSWLGQDRGSVQPVQTHAGAVLGAASEFKAAQPGGPRSRAGKWPDVDRVLYGPVVRTRGNDARPADQIASMNKGN